MTDKRETTHWLERPATLRRLWWCFGTVLSLTVLAQLFIGVKGAVGIDDWFGFGALYGFLSCLAMVLVAKLLGVFLKRRDDYFAEPDDYFAGRPGADGDGGD